MRFILSILTQLLLNTLLLCASPNIIFVLTDDLGYGDLGVLFQNSHTPTDPDKKLITPYLDNMASEGMILDRHYCPAPVCAPSRASLLSGMHQGNAKVRNNQFDRDIGENHTIATVLQEAGYYTACIGKWGLQGSGADPITGMSGFPTKRGFDYFYGYHNHVGGHIHYPIDYWALGNSPNHRNDPGYEKKVYENTNEISASLAKCYTTDLFTARAKKLIIDETINNPERPFFLYLAYDTPHAALQLPTMEYPSGKGVSGGLQWNGTSGNMINTATGTTDSYYNPYYTGHGWPEEDQRFATMVTRIDHAMGDLIQTLKDLAIDNNTLIVFSSDNGPHTESYMSGVDYSPTAFSSYGPFEGTKRDLNEGGWRVPSLAWGPGNIPANTKTTQPSQFHDWLTTFADYADITPPANGDGVSLRPTLSGFSTQQQGFVYSEYYYNGSTANHEDFSNHGGDRRDQQQAIYLDGYKGIRSAINAHTDDFEIYDTLTDLSEEHNLAGSSPYFIDLQQRMKDSVLQWRMPHEEERPYDSEFVPSIAVPYTSGLNVDRFEGAWAWIPEFETLTPKSSSVVSNVSVSHLSTQNNAGLYYSGFIEVPTDGIWKFYSSSDTGTVLRIHEALVIDDDFTHDGSEATGSINLAAGLHPVRLYYRTSVAEASLTLSWEGPGKTKSNIPDTAFKVEILAPPEPVANNDTVSLFGDTSTLLHVLDNDFDDGLPSALSIQSVSSPSLGTAIIQGSQILYTSHIGSYGTDSFTYTITDGVNTAQATITLKISVPIGDLWFPLNEVSGTGVFEAGGALLGSVVNTTNTTSIHVPARHGYGLSLDGINEQINLTGLNLPAGANERTVSAWVKTAAIQGVDTNVENQTFFSYGSNQTGQRFSCRIDTASGALRLEVQSGAIIGTTPINDGEWHHVVIVIEPGVTNLNGVKLYVDGVLETISSTASIALNTTAVTNAVIGGSPHNTNYNYKGVIDEVRIFSRGLSASEILDLYEDSDQAAESWYYQYFGDANIDWIHDTDNDGLTLREEYAFGGSPNKLDAKKFLSVGISADEQRHTFTFPRRITDSHDLTYSIEHSTDLQTWEPYNASAMSSSPLTDPEFETVTFESTSSAYSEEKEFFRINAE